MRKHKARKTKEERLIEIQSRRSNLGTREEEVRLNEEIAELDQEYERIMQQQSRQLWLREGDRNTKFFHTAMIIRSKRNFIGEFQTDQGDWLHTRDAIGNLLSTKFAEVLRSDKPMIPGELEELIAPVITPEENERIGAKPGAVEIKKMVWEMHPLKAPGPDGFQGAFYRKHWGTVGEELVACVQDFFVSGVMNKDLNKNLVVLIPKVQGATTLSLCNFALKVITKIITSRLRPMLDKIISPFQSAFFRKTDSGKHDLSPRTTKCH